MNYIYPVKIVLSKDTKDEKKLLNRNAVQAGFTTDNCCVVEDGGFVLLDFGKEMNGGIVITTQEVSDLKQNCRIVFGESVMEALSSIGEKNATNDHSVRDMLVQLVGMSTMTFGNTGFRFVKVEAVGARLVIKTVCAKPEIKELDYQGSFECDDERLNQIWKTGAYTVHLNMHEYLWDGIKRDRLVWVGDMHPEVSTIRSVFGYDDCVANSLDFIKNETSPEEWMNTVPSYSMWWVLIHYDWYMQNGDLEYLEKQRDYMIAMMNHAIEWIRTFELTDAVGVEAMVDWSSRSYPEVSMNGVYAIFSMAMEAAEKIFIIFDEKEMAKKCYETKEWIQSRQYDVPKQKQIAALCSLAEFEDSKVIHDNVLADNPMDGLSTFIGYYVLKAYAKAGDLEGALDVIRTYWGAMLDMGATTFWEDFDINWIHNAARIDEIVPEGKADIHGDYGKHCYIKFRHSLCHGWASGPTAFLSEYLLGVEILEPGCTKVKISPKLGDLNWVKGTYPTPYGIIRISATRNGDKIVTKVEVPDEIELI